MTGPKKAEPSGGEKDRIGLPTPPPARSTAEQWERPGRRSHGAHFTVASFARYLVHDPVHHLADVTR